MYEDNLYSLNVVTQAAAAAMSAAAGLKVSPQSTPSRDSPFDRGSPASGGTDLNSAAGLLGSGVGVIGSGLGGGGVVSSVSPTMSATSQSLSSYNPIWNPARYVLSFSMSSR